MPHDESLYPGDWVRIAEKDLARVTTLLEIHDPEDDVRTSLEQVRPLIERLRSLTSR
jgi:hypothetical protein